MDRPTPAGEAPTGEFSKLGDVDVYIAKPSDYPHSPSKLLLMLTGGTGIKSTNNQLQADKYASEGFLVIMPDQFGGDPAPNSSTEIPAESNPSFLEQVKLGFAEGAKAFLIDMWLARHTPEKVLPILHKVVGAAKEEFADAVANGNGIYGVGYCFGAKYILLLGAEVADTGAAKADEEQGNMKQPPVLKAGAIAHGTLVTQEDIEGLKVPTYVVAIENDPLFPDEIRKEGVKTLETNKIEHEVKLYSGVPHGFAVLGDYDDAKIKSSQTQAYSEMLGWLQAH
ncbi:alpha/beta-hydrolase [Pseudovirgaria hyperparasitica]|uniref:Alpha/beta-hydrolase n=1 Tax=Pseudovirgaria hyperparasitica TaxID=470096 RepID=A0A6A6VX42_9PEZI|nr:alpha/beta-hydrolase [Pseudovirgaria hyperparasitica]KAF2753827.1 alpha/beta-hydrolase [Pseudovirgaria hyperparasitica]